MTVSVGDKVKILIDDYTTGVVVEVDRRAKGWGYDTRVLLDDGVETDPVPFDYNELEKING